MVSWLQGMNGSPRPPTYGFCVPPPGRLVFLLANKVKPVFIFFFSSNTRHSIYSSLDWIYYSNFFFCLLLQAHAGTRCMSKSKLNVNVKGAVRCSYVQRCSRAKYVSQIPRCGRRAFLYTAGGHFPWNLNVMFKSKIIRILANSQFWAFYVHFEDG